MNIYLEIFGYIGTILVVISLMMTSLTKLRILNLSGSIISAVYAFICGAIPLAVMNVCLILINLFHLLKNYYKKK